MRKFLPIALLVLSGCYQPTADPVASSPPAQAEAPPGPAVPPLYVPVDPSDSFLKGYRDGYNGTWLAPGRWLVKDDYRQGWSLGNHDRQQGIDRYPM